MANLTALATAPARRFAAVFSPPSRTVLALAVICFVAAAHFVPHLLTASSGPDDVTWAKRSLEPWWFGEPRLIGEQWTALGHRRYYYCVHHPSLARIVYRWTLRSAGVTSLPMEEWDYEADSAANVAMGRVLPYAIRTPLRMVNFSFYLAAIILAYLGLNAVVHNRALAVFGALAVFIDPGAARGLNDAVTYIGADSALAFLTMLSWFVWLKSPQCSLRNAVLVGFVCGLAAATKVNGSFVLLGALGYYAAFSRGWNRLALPLAALAAAAGVFLALNPVYFGGGFGWAAKVFRDTIRVMFYLREVTTVTAWGSYTRFEVIMATLPHLFFVVPVLAICAQWRRDVWFRVTAFWAVPPIVLNLCLVYMYMSRYATPVRTGFLVLFMSAGLKAFQTIRSAHPGAGTRNPHAGSAGGGLSAAAEGCCDG